MRGDKLHDFALGPAPVVGGIAIVPAFAFAEEGAVAAVRRLDIGDIGIGGDAGSGLRRLFLSHPPLDERIAALQNQR